MPVGTEIERKFLLEHLPDELEARSSTPIAQGYLLEGHAGLEVRVRRAAGRCTLTLKSGRGVMRGEEEIEIDPERFARLWGLTEGRRIEKVRHVFALPGDHAAEVDVYEGHLRGLITAEVEFADEAGAERFVAPPWMGREVTGDPRFSNAALAREGLPA